MREIKFRALKDDVSDCKFVYGNLIYENEVPRIQEDNTVCLFTTCLKGTEGQLTGLKDKNGKEIYEGDIVRRYDDKSIFDSPPTEHEIIWGQKGGFHAKGTLFDFLAEFVYNMNGKNVCTIIGNIHENSKSLKNDD